MPSHSNDLKARLVVAAAAALGLSAGCSSSDEPDSVAEPPPTSSGTEDESPSEATPELSPDTDSVAAPVEQPAPPDSRELSLDEAVERPVEANAPAPATGARRRRPAAPSTAGQGPGRLQEVVCGASCGADCGGVPDDEEDED